MTLDDFGDPDRFNGDFGERSMLVSADSGEDVDRDQVQDSIRRLGRSNQKFNRKIRTTLASVYGTIAGFFIISIFCDFFTPTSFLSHASGLARSSHRESTSLVAISDALTAATCILLSVWIKKNPLHPCPGVRTAALVLSIVVLPLWTSVVSIVMTASFFNMRWDEWIYPFVPLVAYKFVKLVDGLIVASEVGMRELRQVGVSIED
ncbi:hypothetical protein J8273_7842 [Carpediemonas membranifera]|uniref:Uncharacterized protein n=1 Tax=Carpediemonas membranifera TaxID=201153 RepID=A0A8J6DZJ7_9EUKA|nr:hypothetical protein J8273_7842 [Carpediemonas membranifera]|eukprot:KAG9390491.1 hypothetical protein J8273_7842 [Carpediemonas membranifera]